MCFAHLLQSCDEWCSQSFNMNVHSVYVCFVWWNDTIGHPKYHKHKNNLTQAQFKTEVALLCRYSVFCVYVCVFLTYS